MKKIKEIEWGRRMEPKNKFPHIRELQTRIMLCMKDCAVVQIFYLECCENDSFLQLGKISISGPGNHLELNIFGPNGPIWIEIDVYGFYDYYFPLFDISDFYRAKLPKFQLFCPFFHFVIISHLCTTIHYIPSPDGQKLIRQSHK